MLLKRLLVWLLALALAVAPAAATETPKILGQLYPAVGGATCTISNASPGVVTETGSNAQAGDQVIILTSGSLPTGLTAGQVYFIISAGLGANSFEVSATKGGAAINTSSAGSGTHTCNIYSLLYIPSGSNAAVISTITVANLSSSNDTFKISVHSADAALTNKMFIAGSVNNSVGVTVPGNDTIVLTLGITLANGDAIHVWSQNGTTAFNIFGMEVQ